ncbi:cobalamin (vitamin B12) biosynthesis CbiM protein [Pyrolobus fumarii 1A]|uniref:Cobalamin (Vitamin B12) biosynthesis CbiM protein n=1 Tax=Pyrolobus fumarii (strain DSM 11204 / 1A) TaxID=694429 RepID=G0EHE6_PYRF1|nr:energy-coupling factor ABC transporter permease [Pyrolobus fumarii]AEM38521.1 cobalamin (vitamin B12) biosynthesis CbiM protein [Pyrolobus fumarii 1A]
MHIPDGFLSLPWVVATYAATLAFGVIALRKARSVWGPATAAAVTVLAAAIFVAQMLNWPIPGGTSLHFVGGALAGILLGPWLGFLAMSLVLIVQCLVFHDGGITALGANILNMAIIDVLVGYYVYRLVYGALGGSRTGRLLGAFLGGWLGITLAGVACGLEIGLSPQFPYGVAVTVPVMGFWHAVLGVIEGVITALVVDYVYSRAPHLVVSKARMVEAVAARG